MYYVIQRHHGDPKRHYIAYSVPKYISSDTSENIIFEFKQDGQVKRKWTAKKEIVLLTDNKELFETTLRKLEALKQTHLAKIDQAEKHLEHEIALLLGTMQKQFDDIKKST